jgi:hypothetical protein
VLGCKLHIPFTRESADLQANAGMMHVTVNHDVPAFQWISIHEIGVYDPARRERHLSNYVSLRMPQSEDHTTSFGSTSFSVKWYEDQPEARYSRFWFPCFGPACIFSILPSLAFLRWRNVVFRSSAGDSCRKHKRR